MNIWIGTSYCGVELKVVSWSIRDVKRKEVILEYSLTNCTTSYVDENIRGRKELRTKNKRSVHAFIVLIVVVTIFIPNSNIS